MGAAAKAATPYLLQALQSEDVLTRGFSIRALGKVKPPAKETVPMLRNILQDPKQRNVRAAALDALAGYPEEAEQTIPLFWKVFDLGDPDDKDLDRGLKEGVVFHLGRMGAEAKPALPRITAIFSDKSQSESLRRSCLEVMKGLGPHAKDAVPAIMKALLDAKDPLGPGVLPVLSAIGEPAVPALISALKHPNSTVRELVAEALGNMGPRAKDALPVLAGLLNSEPDRLVRQSVEIALKKIQAKR
jgi:HEAT repeat protein